MLIENNLEQLIQGIMRHGPNILDNCVAEPSAVSKYLERIDNERLHYPVPLSEIDSSNWFIPNEYKNMDIEEFLVNECPKENYQRLIEELALYRQHGMMPVLNAMKFLVDTLRKNNVVWGVGRGSSVASYTLYLIGVHKIDSIKYNLPIEEFFKGE